MADEDDDEEEEVDFLEPPEKDVRVDDDEDDDDRDSDDGRDDQDVSESRSCLSPRRARRFLCVLLCRFLVAPVFAVGASGVVGVSRSTSGS